MNWRDFLTLASRLAAGNTEAEWRSAVSRAYYTVFHVARSLLRDLNFAVPRADRSHQFLVFRLCNCSDSVVEAAGRDLESLRRSRNRADYDEAPPISQSLANGAVQLAVDIVRVLDDAKIEPVRTQIMDAMKVYERDVLHDVTWQP